MEKRMTAGRLAITIRGYSDYIDVAFNESFESAKKYVKADRRATLEAAVERVCKDRYIKIKDNEGVSIPD